MTVIRKRPGEQLEAISIDHSLKTLQSEVGGDIQGIYPFKGPYSIICNETGKVDKLMPNIALVSDLEVVDILFGTVLFVRLSDDDYTDLKPEDIEFISSKIDCKNRLCIYGKHLLPTIQCEE